MKRKTSIESSQVTASVDEVRSSVYEVKRTTLVDSSADDSLRVDDLDESLGCRDSLQTLNK